MIRQLGKCVFVLSLTAVARAGIDRGDCRVAGSTLQFCDPAGVACTTSAGEAGTCTQRREGCECVPKKTSICHRTRGANPYVQIDVSDNAVSAHLRHGDCIIDDGDSCTRDRCDSQLGCVHTPEDTDCDDEDACTIDQCDPDGGCTHEPLCLTDDDCATDVCIIASCTDDGCCVAIDRCPPTTGSCRNVTGACDEDGACIVANEPDGTPCDSTTGSTLCGENGCDAACREGVCRASVCPEGSIELSNATCGIPCETTSDCDGTGCGPHVCATTTDGVSVCFSMSSFSGECSYNTECAAGMACSGNQCGVVCQPQ